MGGNRPVHAASHCVLRALLALVCFGFVIVAGLDRAEAHPATYSSADDVTLDLENIAFDLENVTFDLENIALNIENVTLNIENVTLDIETFVASLPDYAFEPCGQRWFEAFSRCKVELCSKCKVSSAPEIPVAPQVFGVTKLPFVWLASFERRVLRDPTPP